MGKNFFALIQPNMSIKCKDPATFTILCTIGSKQFTYPVLDLGASINVMPKLVYESLQIEELQRTGVVIQLDNRSITHLEGVPWACFGKSK